MRGNQCHWCGESLIWQQDVDADELRLSDAEGTCAIFRCVECESLAVFTPPER